MSEIETYSTIKITNARSLFFQLLLVYHAGKNGRSHNEAMCLSFVSDYPFCISQSDVCLSFDMINIKPHVQQINCELIALRSLLVLAIFQTLCLR